jgi:hypothetical protein
MDARGARRTRLKRTAKSCGPDAAELASSCVELFAQRRWQRAVHRGEHEVSRKAIAQGRPECSRCPVCSCALLVSANGTRDRGCGEHPVFPAPSNGARNSGNLGSHVARSRVIFGRQTRLVRMRTGAGIYSRGSMIEPSSPAYGYPHSRTTRCVSLSTSLRAQRSNPIVTSRT